MKKIARSSIFSGDDKPFQFRVRSREHFKHRGINVFFTKNTHGDGHRIRRY